MIGTFFHWGPFVANYKLSDNFCNTLKEKGDMRKEQKLYANKSLAGHFNTEYYFNDDDIQWFVNNTQHIFTDYFEGRKAYDGSKDNIDVKIKLTPMWINYMKAGDFNPIHTHTGDLSFVLFLDVPSELKTENMEERNNDKHGGPGALTFIHGDITDYSISCNTIFPEKGDMFVFPARVRHMVYPFKSKVERVSVSGNLEYI